MGHSRHTHIVVSSTSTLHMLGHILQKCSKRFNKRQHAVFFTASDTPVKAAGGTGLVIKTANDIYQTENHSSTSLLNFLQAGCTSRRPTNSVKALQATNKQ